MQHQKITLCIGVMDDIAISQLIIVIDCLIFQIIIVPDSVYHSYIFSPLLVSL